jgi:uncharacterized membrane protein YraQ (UPF0718 family)
MVADLPSGLVLTAVIAWRQVVQLGAYVLGGVLLSALVAQFGQPRRWARRLLGNGPAPVVAAAALGGLSPISTHSMIPLTIQLLRSGASPGAPLAFLVASSMLNPQVLLLTLGGLGWRITLGQLSGVLLISTTLGLLVSRLPPASFLRPVPEIVAEASPDRRSAFSWSSLALDVIGLTGWIGLTFVVGVVLTALLQVFVPAQWVLRGLGEGQWTSVVLAGLLGVPLYTCGGAAVPVLDGLMDAGMGAGPALAFLLSGAATRITSLAALSSLLTRRALVIYTVGVVIAAVALGLLLG